MATTQMSFAEIGTLYNTISNELEGGVTPQNQTTLLNQVATVQTQIQGLVDSGVFNNLIDDVGNPNPGAVVRAQNISDQMNFLKRKSALTAEAHLTPNTSTMSSGMFRTSWAMTTTWLRSPNRAVIPVSNRSPFSSRLRHPSPIQARKPLPFCNLSQTRIR